MVAPTYNNAATLCTVLAGVRALGLPVIVVNDGCTDDTTARLQTFIASQPAAAVTVVMHEKNQGKAAALRTGFDEAGRRGYTHAVTIDTDGQHAPSDIPSLLEAAAKEPTALILGERTSATGETPGASMLGRRMANLAIHGSTGQWVRDSQCGLRVYPLALLEGVPCRTSRYAFESEIITRALWAGWSVVPVPVTSRYAPPEERVSHFRPLLDSAHGILLQLLLLIREWFLLPHRCTAKTKAPRRKQPWLEWMHPAGLMQQARGDSGQQTALAAGLAIGVFIGCLPLYPLQPLIAFYTARRWRLHPLSMLAGSLISLPPLGPLVVIASLFIGHLLLQWSVPDLSAFDFSWLTGTLDLLGRAPLEWLIGSLLVGTVTTVLAFFVIWAILSRRPRGSNAAAAALPGSQAPSK
ncbi:MAG: DUF2062 domain-containing protein [Phycisphaeraceae bacterium]